MQIPASSFRPTSSTVTWDYSADGYIHATAGGGLWAPVTLPEGAYVTYLDLYFYDDDPGTDLIARLRVQDATSSSGPPIEVATVSSVGWGAATSGYGYSFAPLRHTVSQSDGRFYTVSVDGSSVNLRFKGVDLWWQRQVSPAPVTASFADVPTTHLFFQWIEALYAAGITGGCGIPPPPPLNYCPDDVVTRGQMAVFLAKALGLYFPER